MVCVATAMIQRLEFNQIPIKIWTAPAFWEGCKVKYKLMETMKTLNVANCRLIRDNKEQILNMNKRMKVRRKSRRLPSVIPTSSSSSSTSSSLMLSWFASQTRRTAPAVTTTTTTTTKTMLISLLTLCHLLGYTFCIGKWVFFVLSFLTSHHSFDFLFFSYHHRHCCCMSVCVCAYVRISVCW